MATETNQLYKNIGTSVTDMRSQFDQLTNQGNPINNITYSYGDLTGNALENNTTVQRYMQLLDQYVGTEYEKELLSIWPSVFQGYNPTGMENFLSHFGVRTGEDDFLLNHNQDIQSKLNDIESRIREEYHNSEAQSIAREKAAGLNPDLTGISNQAAGQASEGDPFSLSPVNGVENQAAGLDFAKSLVSMPFQFVSSAVEMANMIYSLKGLKSETLKKEISAEGDADEYIIKLLAGTAPIWKKNEKGEDIIGDIDTVATAEKLNEAYTSFDVRKIQSPTLRKALQRAKGRYKMQNNSYPIAVASAIARMQKNYSSDMSDLGQIMGNPNFDDNFQKMIQNFGTLYESTTGNYIAFQNKMRNLQVEYQEYVNNYQEAESKYHNEQIKELMAKGIPAKEAAFQAYQLRSQSEFEQFMADQNQSWKDMMKSIPGDGMWSSIARALLGALRVQVMDKLNAFNYLPRSANSPAPVASGFEASPGNNGSFTVSGW